MKKNLNSITVLVIDWIIQYCSTVLWYGIYYLARPFVPFILSWFFLVTGFLTAGLSGVSPLVAFRVYSFASSGGAAALAKSA